MTVKTYLKGNSKTEMREMKAVYLNGVGQGFGLANFWSKRHGLQQMYCAPDSLPMDGDAYMHMVDRAIERLRPHMPKTQLDDLPVAMLLQRALIDTFPCRSDPK